jgi:poly(hydroxyalkanoate) depolymerase family esterase
MAKAAPRVRLLRSMVRAAKSQTSMLVKVLNVYAPAPAKPPRKSAPRKAPAARAPAPAPAAAPRGEPRPGLPPATGKWLLGHFPMPLKPGQVATQSMSYWLYVPHRVPDTVARHGWPLVVMLHGCQQSAGEFAQGTRMNAVAEEKGFAVLYPQQLVSVQSQRCWPWYDQLTQQGGGQTVVLADLIGKVCTDYPIDRRRVYACGISAGAGMAAVLALNHPELIAAVGMHSGPVFGAGHSIVGAMHVMRHGAAAKADAAILDVLRRRAAGVLPAAVPAMPPMPAVLIQGEDDSVVRPVNLQQLARQWLQVNGLPPGPATRVALKPAGRGGSRNAHEIHDYLVGRKVMVRVARIAGLGHAWSGGDPAMRFSDKAGPDASSMMLEFFGKHRRG